MFLWGSQLQKDGQEGHRLLNTLDLYYFFLDKPIIIIVIIIIVVVILVHGCHHINANLVTCIHQE